jgi:SAM-dependent methyltransferase
MPPTIFDRRVLRQRRGRAAERAEDYRFLLTAMAERLLDRLEDITRTFPLALDLGCHDGTLARMLGACGGIETLVQCDLSEPMLRHAGGLRAAADEECLPFAADTFDLVLSCGSLHWVNDLPGTLAQIRQLLKPDGLFLALLPGGETLHELRTAATEAQIAQEGGLSPRVSPFLDLRDAGALLQRAGFALPVADSDTLTVRYDNAFTLMHDLRGMGEANVLAGRAKHFTRRTTMMATAEAYCTLFLGEDGRMPATFELVTLTGWKPHASQPQALKPGSGTVGLGAALR